MKIDIDRLTEAELNELHHRVVERLRFLEQMRAHGTMLEFSIGERVTFSPGDRLPVVGMLVKYNKKTNNFVDITIFSEQFPSFHKQFGFELLGKVEGIDFGEANRKGKNIRHNIVCLLTEEEKLDYKISLRVLQPMFFEMVEQMNE